MREVGKMININKGTKQNLFFTGLKAWGPLKGKGGGKSSVKGEREVWETEVHACLAQPFFLKEARLSIQVNWKRGERERFSKQGEMKGNS